MLNTRLIKFYVALEQEIVCILHPHLYGISASGLINASFNKNASVQPYPNSNVASSQAIPTSHYSPNPYTQPSIAGYPNNAPNTYGQHPSHGFGYNGPNAHTSSGYGIHGPNAYGQPQSQVFGYSAPNAYGQPPSQVFGHIQAGLARPPNKQPWGGASSYNHGGTQPYPPGSSNPSIPEDFNLNSMEPNQKQEYLQKLGLLPQKYEARSSACMWARYFEGKDPYGPLNT
ncbi:hypothetical protein PtA15_9A566 [Puccinia triticina]|uniref:Uncharacterized protein n=1 Tax=Puccinia triticina TaxID=208348 RepID=A0ABY7CT34_9BASI|nr:uncharacterized protein PtA15_9A566 [Puccinia triticina]WAQ88439.1 hypothetical protein PtA15_9A566 [Puccinia triticina]